MMNIDVGFKPNYLLFQANTLVDNISYYNSDVSTTTFQYAERSTTAHTENLGNTTNGRLKSINSNGFTVNKTGSGDLQLYYFAFE